LRQAGAQIEEIALDEISALAFINATGGLAAAESHAWRHTLIAEHEALYDPRVALHIQHGDTVLDLALQVESTLAVSLQK
jgi:aspartyl-tRNA(Asn)/glutamyl-tRNA(Gln) amidotransferase subunit A